MPGQAELIERMLSKIKPNGVHRIDLILADLLTDAYNRNQECIKTELPELEKILRQYGSNRAVDYDKYYLPYLTHYMPKNYAKVQNILFELMRKDLLPEKMQIMDIGSGQGTSAFAIANFFTELAEAERELGMARTHEIKVFSTEKHKNNRDAFKILRDRYCGRNEYAQQNIKMEDPWDSTAHQGIEITESSKGAYDLVILSNVLTEMHDAFDQTVAKISQLVNPAGTIALIETSDKVGTNKLNRAKEVLKGEGMTIYSPSGIWHPFCEFKDTADYAKYGWGLEGPCTFCAIEKPNMQQLRYEGAEGSRKDIKYSFVMMRKDGIHLHDKKPGPSYVKMKDLKPIGRTNVKLFVQRQKGTWDNPAIADISGSKYYVRYACDGTCGRNHAFLLARLHHNNRINTDSCDGDILDIQNALITQEKYSFKTEIVADENTIIKIEKNTL